MGTSAFIIKKYKEKTIEELYQDIKLAAERAGCDCFTDSEWGRDETGDSYVICHIWGYVDQNNTYYGPKKRRLTLHIRSTGKDKTLYDWIEEGAGLVRAITVECIGNGEELLLRFLKEYMKLNPEDYFVVGDTVCEEAKWYFTFKEIEEAEEIDDFWCYINPHIRLRMWFDYLNGPTSDY